MSAVRLALAPVTRTNLRTFAGRAARLEPSGVARLAVRSGSLAVTVRARQGKGLLAAGQALGLRVLPAPAGLDLEVTIRLSALLAALGGATPETEALLEVEASQSDRAGRRMGGHGRTARRMGPGRGRGLR